MPATPYRACSGSSFPSAQESREGIPAGRDAADGRNRTWDAAEALTIVKVACDALFGFDGRMTVSTPEDYFADLDREELRPEQMNLREVVMLLAVEAADGPDIIIIDQDAGGIARNLVEEAFRRHDDGETLSPFQSSVIEGRIGRTCLSPKSQPAKNLRRYSPFLKKNCNLLRTRIFALFSRLAAATFFEVM